MKRRWKVGDAIRFANAVFHLETDECIRWPFNYTKGYPALRYDGKTGYAHIYICERANGPKPTSLHEAMHSCHHEWCINKKHLSWGTHQENEASKPIESRRAASRILTDDAVRSIRIALKSGVSMQALATEHRVAYSTINNIKRNHRWKELS